VHCAWYYKNEEIPVFLVYMTCPPLYHLTGNIKVGKGAIINPGAVVTKGVEEYTRVSGIPAKVLEMIPRSSLKAKDDLYYII
jgi:hypothetical protein